jgi:hypothetical protein
MAALRIGVMSRATRCLTVCFVALLELAGPASAFDLPPRCNPHKMAEMIRLAERVCPLKPTTYALEFLAWVDKERADPACLDSARRYVSEQRKSMLRNWCAAAEYIVNSDPDPRKRWLVPR